MAARPCTYTFTDQHGAVKTLGLDEFKAYLASGGLQELLPGGIPGTAQFSRPPAETPQFEQAPEERSALWKRWFGKSKMVSKGQPINFYHGSPEEVTVFNKDKLGGNTKHPSAGLGFFFTRDKGEATNYGGKVIEVYLSSQNPYVTNSWDIDRNFDSVEGAKKFAKQLQSKGYDSIYLKDAGYAVMFDSNQAKLTSNKAPTFGEDVRFSRPDFISESDANTLAAAREEGYKGDSATEAEEWLGAVSKGLDMSTEARMSRAKSMGFDIGNVYYHASRKGENIYAFGNRILKTSLFNGLGVHVGTRKAALDRAEKTRELDMDTGRLKPDTSVYYPLYIRPGRKMLASGNQVMDEYGVEARLDELAKSIGKDRAIPADRAAIQHKVWDLYGSVPYINDVEDKGSVSHIVPPKNIRSVYAAFDPNRADSTYIMASLARKTFPENINAEYIANGKPESKDERVSNIIDTEAAIDHLKANFGVGIDNLISAGVLNFTTGKDIWPEVARNAARGDEEAVYVNGKVYIDLGHTPQSRLNAVMLHEIGEHYGLRRMLGDHAYQSLQQQIENRAKIAGSQAARVWQEVKDNYEHLQEGSEPFIAEVIAKLGEENPKAPWYRRILAHIKSFLMKMGLAKGIVAGTITEADLHELLITSLRKSANGARRAEVSLYGGEGLTAEPAYSVPSGTQTHQETQAVQKDLFDKLQSYYGSDKLAGQAVGWMGNKLHETMTALANGEFMFLSVRQLADRMKYAMPKLQEYVEHMQNRGAEAGYWRRMADRLVKPWTKLEDIELANRTIQNSTRQDIDASLEWTGVNFVENTDVRSDNFGEKYYAAYTQELLSKGRRQKLAAAAMQAGALPINQSAEAKADPDNYIRRGGFAFTTKEQAENFANVIAGVVKEQREDRSRKAHERGVENTDPNLIRQYGEKIPGGMPGYEEIKKDYEKLSDKAKEIYSEQNKMLTQLFDARAQELINDIDMAVEDRKQAAMLIKSVRLQFETSALNFYYSPLSRYGDFWFYGTDANGMLTYRTFKTEGERDRAKKEFIASGGKGVNGYPIAYGKNFEKLDEPGSPAAGDAFIAKIVTEVRNSNIDKDQQEILLDTIYQMYLDTLPDISVRHSGTHRKGTLGFDTDAAKNFANAMHHGATQIANLKHGRKMRKVLDLHDMALKYATSPQLAGVLEDKIKAEQWMMDNWDTYTSEYLHNLQRVPDLAAEHGWTDTMLQEAINLRNTFGELDEDGAIEAIGRRLGDNEHIMELKKYMRQEDSTRLANALAEMYKSYNYTVAYKAGDMDNVATFLNKMNFMFSLGLGVSSGMVNTLQVPMVAMPIAAGKYGYANTTREYSKAYGEFLTAVKRRMTDVDGNVSITEILNEKLAAARKRNDLEAIADLEDEITAMNYFKDADDIARTRQFDLMGIAEEGYSYGGKFNQLSSIAGWMFHHGERFNREVTLLATYRLARQALRDGKMKGSLPLYSQTTLNEGGRVTQFTSPRAINHMQSIALARELNYEAHMDYGMENAARLFRGPFRKMAFQFKKYQQGMYWLWAKQLAESYGKKPVRTDFPEGEHGDKLFKSALEDREIARKTLKSILLAQVAFGGAMTLPALGAFQVVYETLAQAFGEPDEPEDMEKDIRMALYPLIGQAATEAFMTGLFNAFTPLNVSSRISLKDTFFHEPLTELEGREAATEYLSQVLGVTGGQFQKWWQAINLAAQGHGDRALEMSMPKAIGDVLKASRLGREGVTTLDQMPVREPSMFEVAAQAIGFSSAPTSRAYTERGYAKEHEKAIEETRTEIMRNEARAKLNGEVPDLTARLEWNRKHPELPIYPAHVEASRRGIEKSIKVREEHGYSVNPKLDYLYEENELYDAD